jgi:Tfp pilus assembly PilM family ATPase
MGGHHFDQQIAKSLKCEIHEASTQRHAFGQPLSRSVGEDESSQEELMSHGAEQDSASKAGLAEDSDSPVAVATRPTNPETIEGHLPVPMCGSAQSIIERYDLAEQVDTLVDEVSMCMRYHRGLFGNLPIAKAVFVGGDSRQAWLTRTIAEHLTMESSVGDPLRRFAKTKLFTPGFNLNEPRPGWAVACGLCHAPTDQ